MITVFALLNSQAKLLLVSFIVFGSIVAGVLVLLLRKMLNDQINEQLAKKIPKSLRRFVDFKIKWR